MKWSRRRSAPAEGVRLRRVAALLVALVALVICLASLPGVREWPLLAIGRVLVEEDAVSGVANIALPSSGDGHALLEVAALASRYPDARVIRFDVDDPLLDQAFARRGVPYPSADRRAGDLLAALGVDPGRQTSLMPRQGGTRGEMQVLAEWMRAHGATTVLVVSNWHHSARLKRTLRRELPAGAQGFVRIPGHDRALGQTWWRHRSGRRLAVTELQKLLADFVVHPIS